MKGRLGLHIGKRWLGFRGIPEDLSRNTAVSVSQSAIEVGGWESGGRPVSVRIPIDIIERLQRTIALQLSAHPPCDVTGVLIGEIAAETSTITVESYELARYTLDGGDPPIGRDERIHELAQRWRQSDGPRRLLGFFRSQRSGVPAIDPGDLRGAGRLLPRGANIFLLIGTAEEHNLTGTLFFRKDRRARIEKQFSEFSFDAGVLRAGWNISNTHRQEPVQPPSAATAKVAAPAAAAVPPVPVEAPTQLAAAAAAGASRIPVVGSRAEDGPPRSSVNESADPGFAATEDDLRARVSAWFAENPEPKASPAGWRSWLSIAATWTIAVGATMWFTNGSSLFGHSSPEAPPSSPVTIPDSIGSEMHSGLEVHSEGQLMDITWDRRSTTALNSSGGYMTIRDGDLVKVVRLEAGEIRTGHIYYAPRNADLGVRLEMAMADGETASETVRVVGPPPQR